MALIALTIGYPGGGVHTPARMIHRPVSLDMRGNGPGMPWHPLLRPAPVSRTRPPKCALQGPRLDEPQLAALDVSIIFSFAFARALSSVLLSPDFAGWLAPINVEPIRFSETLAFAGYASLLWVLGATLVGGYSTYALESPQSAVSMAARSWLAAACLYTLMTFVLALGFDTCAGWFCADAALWGQREMFGPPDTGTLLGAFGLGLALIAWRGTFADFRDPWT